MDLAYPEDIGRGITLRLWGKWRKAIPLNQPSFSPPDRVAVLGMPEKRDCLRTIRVSGLLAFLYERPCAGGEGACIAMVARASPELKPRGIDATSTYRAPMFRLGPLVGNKLGL